MIWVAAVGVIVLAGTGIGAGARIPRTTSAATKKGSQGMREATLRGVHGLQLPGAPVPDARLSHRASSRLSASP